MQHPPTGGFPIEIDEHRRVRDAIWAALPRWTRFVVAVGGVDGAGKTTLARYLSWQLGMPAIETDLYLVPHSGMIRYHDAELRRVINSRILRDRPVIVEGVRVLDVLQEARIGVDFAVWVEQEDWSGTHALSAEFTSYVSRHRPAESADFLFRWSPDLDRD